MTQKQAAGKPSWKSVALGLVLLIALTVFVIAAAWAAWQAVVGLPSQIAASVIAASGAMVVSVGSIAGSKIWDRRLAIEQDHRAQKLPIYSEFLDKFFRGTVGSKYPDLAVAPDAMERYYVEFMPKLVLWGADDVVREYVNFRTGAQAGGRGGETGLELMFAFERLMYSMRRDLGHKNSKLVPGTLLSVFVNDLDQAVATSAHPAADRNARSRTATAALGGARTGV